MNAAQLSIVIITYNRPADMLELAKNIASLDHLELLAEVIIVNNRSSESYAEVERFIDQSPTVPFHYFITESNLGVSKGRNYAIQKSTAPILLFLDDDALFQNKDALLQTINIFNSADESDRKLGIAAFKVYYQSTLHLQETAFPHKQFEERKDLNHFETYYYAGCAHAIKRNVFDDIGFYPESFFYGMEEYDLSYRTINAGYKINYDDRVVVLHKESPEGRLTNREKLRGMWVNKTIVAWKYLPVKYFYTTALLWSFLYLMKTSFHFNGWLKGWKEVTRISNKEQRTPVGKSGLCYLKKVKARLWY